MSIIWIICEKKRYFAWIQGQRGWRALPFKQSHLSPSKIFSLQWWGRGVTFQPRHLIFIWFYFRFWGSWHYQRLRCMESVMSYTSPWPIWWFNQKIHKICWETEDMFAFGTLNKCCIQFQHSNTHIKSESKSRSQILVHHFFP